MLADGGHEAVALAQEIVAAVDVAPSTEEVLLPLLSRLTIAIRNRGLEYYIWDFSAWCPICGTRAEWVCSHTGPPGAHAQCTAWRCCACESRGCAESQYDYDPPTCRCPKHVTFSDEEEDEDPGTWARCEDAFYSEEDADRMRTADAVKPLPRPTPFDNSKIDNNNPAVVVEHIKDLAPCDTCLLGLRLCACRGSGQRGGEAGNASWPWRGVCEVWRCSRPTCTGGGDSVKHPAGQLRCTCAAIGDFVVLHGLVGRSDLNGKTGFIVQPPDVEGATGRSPDRYSIL